VALEDLRFSYPAAGRGRAPLEAVGPLSLDIAPGEFVAFVGPSGCGKSTLLELVCGLLRPSGGRLSGDPAVLMPQRDGLLPWLDALDNAALAPRVRGARREQARAAAHPLMQQLGLAGFESARTYELSGGMRQRVAFARTLLSGKAVLCLDEPFGALDALTRAELAAWLDRALADQPRTTLLVTHDVEEACVLADRVVVLTPRPARVKAVLTVDVPRPRRPTDPRIVALRERALEALAS
jgi:NitT/TauT family transport system ATP-binding protein